jgi:hypothetical protein
VATAIITAIRKKARSTSRPRACRAFGWWGFDVWDSEEAAEHFYRDILGPVVQSFDMPQAQQRKLMVQWDTSQIPPGT